MSYPQLNVDFKTKRDLKELDQFLIDFITNRPKMTTPMDYEVFELNCQARFFEDLKSLKLLCKKFFQSNSQEILSMKQAFEQERAFFMKQIEAQQNDNKKNKITI